MGFWKDTMKRKISLDILAGGNDLNLTGKEIPAGIRSAVMMESDQRGEVVINIPFLSKDKWRIDGIEWEESARRSGGKAAGGSILGAALIGPIGTIAGAVVGGRRRDNSKAYVYLMNPKTNEEIVLHIRCTKKQYKEISAFM
ncbi:hypothetical protein Q8G35_01850 [Peribacillus simplex]|uniref:Uncharacterized protein n=2 Tax=Peribacillus TaxID=2675229 RepID=A0AA90SZG6_9BACI|nr:MULTISPECIES: hypothetical protein [Peribacillus]MDP1417149.1 hypothetical protein [Peribacillus simplex]MDP1449804.1 hypothetical protein [Peribacillus frigoritolerans]